MKNAECRIGIKLTAYMIICLLLAGCAGAGDWSAPLVEDYALWRLSGNHICLVQERDTGGADIIVDALIYRVSWNEEFICVQQTTPLEAGEGLPIAPEVDYYILRVEDGAAFGPFTAEDYKIQCRELGIGTLPDWIYAQDLRQ